MKKYDKEVMQAQLDNEKAVLKKLKETYEDAIFEIDDRLAALLGRDDANLQNVIYQIEYQKALKTQIKAILEKLQADEFETVAQYLEYSYEEGFFGAMYSMQQQGVPLIVPIDQEQVVAAIQHETQLKESLYTEMGKDISRLQKQIAGEISRGISNSATYAEIARNIANYSKIPLNRAMTISRTEAHRISETANSHAQNKAASKGAKLKKIWDASLDAKTRDSHFAVDGEIRELKERFSNGLMYPGESGGKPEEVINCRCRSRSEAEWALTVPETKALGNVRNMSDKRKQEIADKLGIPVEDLEGYGGQIVELKPKNYQDFKKQYKQASERVKRNVQKINGKNTLENNGKSKYTVPKGADLSDWQIKLINTTPEQDVVLANINYNKGELYQTNCQRCVAAYEMRRRGYDVTAKPSILGMDDVADNWLNFFEGMKEIPCHQGNGLAQIEKEMKKFGDGARAEVYVEWSKNNSHVFVAEQREGKTVFFDPQDGKRDAKDYFNYAVDGRTSIFRLDELEPSDLIKECCEEYQYD